jgi:predicted aspartyl protease
MKLRLGMVLAVVSMMSTTTAFGALKTYARASARFFIDENGGGVEVGANDPKDTKARNAIRDGLKEEIQLKTAFTSPAIQKHEKSLSFHFEKTDRGGRVRVTAKTGDARRAIQDFLRSQMNNLTTTGPVPFKFILNTALIAVPVHVNGQGPYTFLFDTGASNTILSQKVADALKLPPGRPYVLSTAAGDINVSIRLVNMLAVGEGRLDNTEIAVATFGMFDQLHVDGILGGDYLRRFKVSIDYENQTVQIQLSPDSTSMAIPA